MAFSRTLSGKQAKYLFYSEPLVWVEGVDDIPFYTELFGTLPVRIEDAGGKPECLKLAQAIIEYDHPYVVVLDGDYGVLDRQRSPHRRVVYLHRYSFENYLFEYRPIERVSKKLAKVDPGEELLGSMFEDTLEYVSYELRELVTLDVAHDRVNSGTEVFPDRVEQVIEGGGGSATRLALDHSRISHLCTEAHQTIMSSVFDNAHELITGFLAQRRLIDLMRGHFIFGLLRRLIFSVTRQHTGRKPRIGDDELKVLLTSELWNLETPGSDHTSLRRRLLRARRDTGRS